MHNIKGYKIHS